jgi:hypothetical protein
LLANTDLWAYSDMQQWMLARASVFARSRAIKKLMNNEFFISIV